VSWERGCPGQKELREFSKRLLPHYAVPALFVPLQALPVSGGTMIKVSELLKLT
jgi:hypothetical protein